MPDADQIRATAEAVARASYGKLVAYLAARKRDVAAAEDALSDAFAAALADWPARGIPDSPEAWLTAVARRRRSMRRGGGTPAKRPRTTCGSSPRNSRIWRMRTKRSPTTAWR